MTVKLVAAWFDLWCGVFWDRAKRSLYVLPLPCLGLVFEFGTKPQPTVEPADAAEARDALSLFYQHLNRYGVVEGGTPQEHASQDACFSAYSAVVEAERKLAARPAARKAQR